jgi:hypothetical protein
MTLSRELIGPTTKVALSIIFGAMVFYVVTISDTSARDAVAPVRTIVDANSIKIALLEQSVEEIKDWQRGSSADNKLIQAQLYEQQKILIRIDSRGNR